MLSWSTVKDATVNLLVFLLVFVLLAALLLAGYSLSLLLIPGGRGLVFANPFASVLLPSLLGGMAVAQARSVRHPGHFGSTLLLQFLAFFLLLTLPLPWIHEAPPVRADDASPLQEGRFLLLADGSELVAQGNATVLVPADERPISVSHETQYDGLYQRFVFSDGPPLGLGNRGPERDYFQFTPALTSFELDLLAIYSSLTDAARNEPLRFWFSAASISWLFLGGYIFFSLKTWSLVRVVTLLVVIRLELAFLVYAFWSLPLLLRLWMPNQLILVHWSGVFLISIAASTLFFMTLVAKPHLRTRIE